MLLLPSVFRLDGKTHADWQQFLGRFHPLVVHLPIGLILLVPLLEIAGRVRPALLEAAMFVLSLSVFSCLLAVTLGYCSRTAAERQGRCDPPHVGSHRADHRCFGCALLRGASAALRGFIRGCSLACWFCWHGQLTRVVRLLMVTTIYSSIFPDR